MTRMIYTLALNPAIDRTFWVDRIDFEETTRVQKECRYPGGKGIDVSRVLTNMDIPNMALGFVGGFVGDELECRLTSEGVRTDLIHISGETRTNIIVHEKDTGRHILLTASGPEIAPYELGALFSKLEGLRDISLLAIGGSLPPGVHPEAYRRIIWAMKKRGMVTLLDADGDALRLGIQGGPTYIKPNRHELSQLVGRELTGLADILDAAEGVRSQGVETVLVSMGADGIVLVGEDRRYLAIPPKVDAVNTVGLGDSAVAGFVYGIATGLEPKECLIYATAAGTATALKPGTARANKKDGVGNGAQDNVQRSFKEQWMMNGTKVVVPLDVPRGKRKMFLDNYTALTGGKGRLMLFAGDQKVEHLNDDFRGEGIAPDDGDPEHLFRIAAGGRIGAFATQYGLVARYAADYPRVPYIVKLNSKTHLVKTLQAEPLSQQWMTVDQVAALKDENDITVLGVGYTVYLGSENEAIMLREAAQIVHRAHHHGLTAILWMYPRGKAVPNEKDPHCDRWGCRSSGLPRI